MEHPWDDGLSLYNFINSVSLHGLTGNIQFNEGRRTNFKLDLLKLKKEKLRPVGYWTSDTGIHITDPEAFYETQTHNITLTVMTRVVGRFLIGGWLGVWMASKRAAAADTKPRFLSCQDNSLKWLLYICNCVL